MMQCLATVLIVLFGLVIFSHAKENKCPEGKACPIQNAVCCGDSAHCCSDGYTYDVMKGICKMGRKLVPLLRKFPAKPIMTKTVSASKTNGEIISPDGFQCPDSQTPCRLSFGPYACCPLPQAVCYSDGNYCCPYCHTCDAAVREGIEGFRTNAVLQKISTLKTSFPPAPNPRCPDGIHWCPVGDTCCPNQHVAFTCCPIPNAVCCPDGLFCCPFGFVCNMILRKCIRVQSRAIFQRLIPTKKGALDMTSYGIKKSIGKVYCGEDIEGFRTKAVLQKISALKTTMPPAPNPLCPDGRHRCPKGQTCCRNQYFGYLCCPVPNAICCFGGLFCCRFGWICNKLLKKCIRVQSIAILQKLTPTKKGTLDMTSYGIKKSIVAELKYIHCPDASSCFDYETCCELADGQYGCCPSSKAVCCSDHEHYCPAGFRCDLTAQMCVTENARLPLLKKANSPRRPKTQQVNLDGKIHFVPVRAHVGDPVTNDD